jgi:ankyrin repeat protein
MLGQHRAAGWLLAAKADANARTASGATALLLACSPENSSKIESLVRARADPNLADWDGLTPLHRMASMDGLMPYAISLVRLNADVNTPMRATTPPPWKQQESLPRRLATAPAPTATTTTTTPTTTTTMTADEAAERETPLTGYTPLHVAAACNSAHMVAFLLSAKAELNRAAAPSGTTPLMAAARHKCDRVVQQLLQAKADPGATDRFGRTAKDCGNNTRYDRSGSSGGGGGGDSRSSARGRASSYDDSGGRRQRSKQCLIM